MEPLRIEHFAASNRLKWIRGLLFLNGVIWLLFSLNSFAFPDQEYGLSGKSVLLLTALMAVNGVILIALGWLVMRSKRWMILASFGYVLINAILSVTDQSGFFDYLVLFLNLVLIVLFAREMQTKFKEN